MRRLDLLFWQWLEDISVLKCYQTACMLVSFYQTMSHKPIIALSRQRYSTWLLLINWWFLSTISCHWLRRWILLSSTPHTSSIFLLQSGIAQKVNSASLVTRGKHFLHVFSKAKEGELKEAIILDSLEYKWAQLNNLTISTFDLSIFHTAC